MGRSHPKLIVALDYPTLHAATAIARRLSGSVDMFKVGLELFSAEGPAALRAIGEVGGPVFYDSKLMDIPNTVAGAAGGIVAAGVAMFNVHTLGGREMMRAAARAAAEKAQQLGAARPLVVGVTVLTSINEESLRDLGVTRSLSEQVTALARAAQEAGLDGVVASAQEIGDIKRACGDDFIVVAPGIRPRGAAQGDQQRVMTPQQAAQAGADYIVVGRPITRAQDPVEAAKRIWQEMASV